MLWFFGLNFFFILVLAKTLNRRPIHCSQFFVPSENGLSLLSITVSFAHFLSFESKSFAYMFVVGIKMQTMKIIWVGKCVEHKIPFSQASPHTAVYNRIRSRQLNASSASVFFILGRLAWGQEVGVASDYHNIIMCYWSHI